MILRTSWEVNRNGLGACERTLKPDPSREGLSGKCQGQNRNREIRPSGLVGGPEKNVTSSMTRCARLGSIPTIRFTYNDAWYPWRDLEQLWLEGHRGTLSVS